MKPKSLRLVVANLLIPVGWLAAAPGDIDNDGLRDAVETNTGIYVSPTNTGTSPSIADTDGDSIPDGLELNLGTSPVSAASKVQRPNIILINCDDLGYGDLGCFWQNQRTGTRKFATPSIDALAAQGTMLTHHYAGAPVCISSRASLIQGRHQGHADLRDLQFDWAVPDNHSIASVLKRAGYRTVHVGKAGIAGQLAGNATSSASIAAHPLYRSFDRFFGYVSHYHAHEHYPRNGTSLAKAWISDDFRKVTDAYEDLYSTDAWTAFAKKTIIEETQGAPQRPFFLYLAYDAPHFANQLPPTREYPAGLGLNGGIQWTGAPSYANTATNDPAKVDNAANQHPSVNPAWADVPKRYVSMIRRVDDSVADIVQTLRDLNIDNNTLIVFTSDNGPANYDGQDPTYFQSFAGFEGIKLDMWEGGLRVPAIAWWPGHIPATNQTNNIRVTSLPSANWDWLPTFAEAAGITAPSYADGVSLLPTLTATGVQQPREYLYFEINNPGGTPAHLGFVNHGGDAQYQSQAIRMGDFMGVRNNINSTTQPFRIYNVVNDTKQATNLAASRPDLANRMLQLAVDSRRPLATAVRPYDTVPMHSVPVPAVMNGLKFKSFEGYWPWIPEFDSMTPVAEGVCPGTRVSVRSRENDVGLVFSGYLAVPTTGSYTFSVNSNSGSSLWIHDSHVIDNDYQFATTKSSGAVYLSAGLQPFRLYYRHQSGTPTLSLSYSGPGITSQVIPESSFFVEGSPPVVLPDAVTTKRNTSALVNVLANDTGTGPLTIGSVGPNLLGSSSIENGMVRFTPELGVLGYSEIPYSVSNGFNQFPSQIAATVLYDQEIWLPLEEGAGTSVNRVGGNVAVSGNLSGFGNPADAWTTGRFHGALAFDGIADHVDFPGLALPTGQQPRTFSCWLRTSSRSAPELQALFSYGSNNIAGRFVVRLDNQANVASDQPLKLEVGSPSGQITGTKPLNDGLWHHVAVVVADHNGNGSVDVSETKLWVDGRLDPVSSSEGRELNTGSTVVPCLGGSNHNDGYNFIGKLDDVRIFDRALGDSEVQALHLSRPIYLTPPVDPTGDSDNDGMSDDAEAIAGTNPDDPSSVLRISKFTLSGNSAQIQWMAIPGRDYQLEEGSDLLFWQAVPGQEPVRIPSSPAVPTMRSIDFSTSGYGSRYYRLKVTLSTS